MKINDKLRVIRGNRTLGLRKGQIVTITTYEEREDRGVKLVVKGCTRGLYVRHVNRLSDTTFNANPGDGVTIVTFGAA